MDDLSQNNLTRLMDERGRERSRSQNARAIQRGDGSNTPAGRAIAGSHTVALATRIKSKLDDAFAGKAGRRATAALLLNGLDEGQLAYLTIRAVVNGILSPGFSPTLNAIAREVGATIDDERRAERFAKSQPRIAKAIAKKAKQRGTTQSRIPRSYKKAEQHFDPVSAEAGWTRQRQIHVGVYLVEAMLEAFPNVVEAVELATGHGKSRRSAHYLTAADGFRAWFTDYNEKAFKPFYLPMVEPPTPWTSPTEGGYPADLIKHPPLVKPRLQSPTHTKLSRNALKAADLTAVYSAVNAIQATPWRINTRVLNALEAWEGWSSDVAAKLKLPAREDEPIEAMDPYLATLATDHEDRRAWRRRQSDIHARNAHANCARVDFDRVLSNARDFAKTPRIYFPHNLDFRGRVYSIPTILSPQGAPHVKALLEFADGKPIGPRGGYWLAIHGANVYGVDKVPFADRVAWAERNTPNALAVADDPFGKAFGFWSDSDSPIETLAWCYEWSGYKRGGNAFVSRLPIALDGSCNGLQHFAALTRDEAIGRAVNLLPGASPNDLYADVAKAAEAQLAKSKHWPASGWRGIGGVSRKIVKTAVLALPYGGTAFGTRERIRDEAAIWLDAYAAENPSAPHPLGTDKDRYDAVQVLAGACWSAMSGMMPNALSAMGLIASCARSAAAKNAPLKWTTPTGFPVVQAAFKSEKEQVRTRFFGRVFKPVDYADTAELDADAMASSAPANFVQSLDAAALMMTVNKCTARGLTAFAMIHDSFATHAADTDTLATGLREAFVELYRNHDPLRDLVSANAPGLVSDIPKGSLDVAHVTESPYFFA